MRLQNTLTGKVEEFVPRDEGRVGMYVCGPTVQGPPHFGHARAAIVPDVLRRYLEWSGYEVFHVRNITDVNDTIIERARAEGRPAAALAEHYACVWDAQIARLGVLPAHIVPRATGHVIEMIQLIERLIAAGAAYESGGDVFFAVRAFPEYGKLSGRRIDELVSGARIEPDPRKRDPLDFALWKGAGADEELTWPSPWGRGRPGWHIECSAMALKYLGEGFDIHAGGTDLVFPHHENEVAQAEAATGAQFARYWIHNGLLTIGERKMSKSIGNIISLEEALGRYGPNALRMFYLAVDYRSPTEFSEARLEESAAAVDRWLAFERATRGLAPGDGAGGDEWRARFREAMEDDLSTPAAQAVLFDLVSEGNRALEAGQREQAGAARAVFLELAGVLGYRFEASDAAGGELVAALVPMLLNVREQARARRDFAQSDAIRDALNALGITVEDSPAGPRWHLQRPTAPARGAGAPAAPAPASDAPA